MRHIVWVSLALAFSVAPAPLPAQTSSAPHLYLSMFGGYRTGRQVWSLHDQPFVVNTLSGPNPGQYDTLDLTQQAVPGFVIGAAGTYFPRPQIGIQGEITFLGLGLESRCAIRQTTTPALGDIDPELCTSLNGATTPLSAVSFAAGVVARLLPQKATYPYVRASVGVVARTRSTIEMIGAYTDASNNLVAARVVGDTAERKTGPYFALGAGVALSLGPSYQLRFEGQHATTRLDRVTGLADPNSGTLYPPHGGRMHHTFLFTVSFDVILEQRRGRRY